MPRRRRKIESGILLPDLKIRVIRSAGYRWRSHNPSAKFKQRDQWWEVECQESGEHMEISHQALINLTQTPFEDAREYKCRSVCEGTLIPVTYWEAVQYRASKEGHTFTITPAEAWSIFEVQQGLCALSHDELTFYTDTRLEGYRESYNASMDRIDNDLGYEWGNVQWVTKLQNIKRNKCPIPRHIEESKKVFLAHMTEADIQAALKRAEELGLHLR